MRNTPILLAIALLAAAAAQANTVSYSSNTVGPVKTSALATFLDLQQFDPGLGTLESVAVQLFADVSGSAAVESRNNRAATVTSSLGASVTLARPDGGVLVVTAPLVSQTFNAARYDGVTDYAGSSGITYANLAANNSNSFSSTAPADLLLFTGTGRLQAPISAAGTSSASGAGNLSAQFSTLVSGHATVTYSYSPLTQVSSVPEPRSWALMLAGMGVLGTLGRRRRRV